MSEETEPAPLRDCSAPEISKLLTAYCFGRANEQERQLVEAHLLECDVCWQEVQRLESGLQTLKTQRGLLQSFSRTDIASVLGISSKLELPFGGHLWHSLLSCVLFGALYAVALLVEIAYQFDRYGSAGIKVAAAVFIWMFITSLGGMALDWKLTIAGKSNALAVSVLFVLFSTALMFAASCLFLPSHPITGSDVQSYTAQGAYLKTIFYFLLLKIAFWLPPFHLVLAMQRELNAGRHKMVLGLLIGDKLSVVPRGAFYPRLWLLILLLTAMAAVTIFLHHNLMNHLTIGAYMNLFTHLVNVRLLLYYGLAVKCLTWYYRALNEIKRECLVA